MLSRLFQKIVPIFGLFLIISIIPAVHADSISVDIKNSVYDINYQSTGVELNSVTADLGFMSLIFDVSVSESGSQIEFTFDRDFFDAKLGSEDDDFFVIADGDEITFTETKNNSQRVILLSVDPGTEEIEIIGSQIIDVSYMVEKAVSDAEEQAKAEEEAKIQEEIKQQEVTSKLEEACGEGTILEDGICVIENPIVESPPIDSSPLIYGMFGAMGIALALVLILWGIGKKSNKHIPKE
mgnify:CR=1 FL=1